MDLFPLSGNVQKYSGTEWSRYPGITKEGGDLAENSEGMCACIHGLEYYWVHERTMYMKIMAPC
jgi:hypothetical protein